MPQRAPIWLAVLLLLVLLPPGAEVVAQTDERCFPETGFCISGRLRQFWELNDGERTLGLPIGPLRTEPAAPGAPSGQAQWFQRHRLELHPDLAAPYDVLLGHLGRDRLARDGRNPAAFPTATPQPGCRYFPETQHNVCDRFLTAWEANGLELDGQPGLTDAERLALFGLPLSEATMEEVNGEQRLVQWFERARFERHDQEAPFDVQFGLLGKELQEAATSPPPTPAPAASTPVPPPAPTPTAAPAPASSAHSPYDGAWYGVLSRGTGLSFTVTNGAVTYLEIDIKPHSDCHIVTKIDYLAAGMTPPPIVNGQLSITAEGPEIVVVLNGTFTTPDRVNGDGNFRSTDSGCSSADRFDWDAKKAPPEEVVANIDGEWSGLTAKAEPISLTVANRTITHMEIVFQNKDECTVVITTPQPLTINSFVLDFEDALGTGYVNGRFTTSNAVEGFLKFVPKDKGCGQGSVSEWRWNARKMG